MASSPGEVTKTIRMLSPFLIRLGFLDMGFFSSGEDSRLHGQAGASWGLSNPFPGYMSVYASFQDLDLAMSLKKGCVIRKRKEKPEAPWFIILYNT